MAAEEFQGKATIKVRFRNAGEYAKFRQYILHTNWNVGDAYPIWEEIQYKFKDIDGLELITKTIVYLLQMGFEVYSARWELEDEARLAEKEHPREEDFLEPMLADRSWIFTRN